MWIVVVVYVTLYFPAIVHLDRNYRCFNSVFAIEVGDVINGNGCESTRNDLHCKLFSLLFAVEVFVQ